MSGTFGKHGGAHIASRPNSKTKEGLDFSYLESKETFKEYYNKLGKKSNQQRQEYRPKKMDCFRPYISDPIIEFGCHIGFNFDMFITEGCNDITGVDCSNSLIEEATKRYGKSSKVTLIEALIEDLPEDKKYKTIVMTDILEHVIDISLILQKAKNLLDDNGYILYCSPSTREGSSSHVRGISKEEIVSLLKQYKLKAYKWFPGYGSDIRLIIQHEK